MTKIDVNHNFYDDDAVKKTYDKEKKLYTDDPDALSKTLYEYHQLLWNKGCLAGLKQNNCVLKLSVENNEINDDIKELRLGADNFVALYMGKDPKTDELKYKAMREKNNNEILNRQLEIRPEGSTERIKYTIGGSIIFPKFTDSLNLARGRYNKNGTAMVGDRIDITLFCIKMWYDATNGKDENQKNNNPLWDCLNKPQNKIFFSLFGTGEEGFKNYINFFLFDDFVNKKYEVKDLCNNYAADETKNDAPVHNEDKYRKPDCAKVIDDNVLGKTNNLPDNAEEYANLYHNLIWAIKQRTERIRNFAKDKKLIDETRQAESFEITFKLSPEE